MSVIPPYVRPGESVFRVRPRLDHVTDDDKVTVSHGTATGGGDVYVLVKWSDNRRPVRENQRNIMYAPRSAADALQQYIAWCDQRLGSMARQIVQVERLRKEAMGMLDREKTT